VSPRAGLDLRKISSPPRDSIPDLPTRSQSLYRLSYPAHYVPWSTANSPVHTVFLLKFSAMFLGVVVVNVAAASCILPASSRKWVGNDGKQKVSLMSTDEWCKVRGTRWPNDKATPAPQFPWKSSIQEDTKCRGEVPSCGNKYD